MKSKPNINKWKFIDLFSGLGGFHQALATLGMKCVFASEIDNSLRELYYDNYGIRPEGDIRLISETDIPKHDVLCAGFPCQPFSLAGSKKGAKCPVSGKLIDDVIRIAKHHRPKYIFLENVPNVLSVDNGRFWNHIEHSLQTIGYHVDYKIYSPTDFGIPQRRKRIFIVARLNNTQEINWPDIRKYQNKPGKNLLNYISKKKGNINTKIDSKKIKILNTWQSILSHIEEISYKFIIVAEFGATYPIHTLHKLRLKDIKEYKGAFGSNLSGCRTWKDALEVLPHYIKDEERQVPQWLIDSIEYSRRIYLENKQIFDELKLEFIQAPNSWQKLQWQGSRSNIDIWQHLIQFRPSGIRIIKPEIAPSLVAMTSTQIPIIGKTQSYMNERQAATLQGLEKLRKLPGNKTAAIKALGNAVNANIIKTIAKNVLA